MVPVDRIHPQILVRREKLCIFSGCNSRPATVVPAGSNRSGDGGNEIVEAFDGKGRLWVVSEQTGRNVSKRRAGLETGNAEADPARIWGRPLLWRGASDKPPQFRRGTGDGMSVQGDDTKHGKP